MSHARFPPVRDEITEIIGPNAKSTPLMPSETDVFQPIPILRNKPTKVKIMVDV